MTTLYFEWTGTEECGFVSGDNPVLPAGATEITQAAYEATVAQKQADAQTALDNFVAAQEAAEAGAQADRDADYADLVAAGIAPATAARLTGGGP